MSERPVECGHCKKPTQVHYKEIVGDHTTCTNMCNDCPVLLRKVHGEVREKQEGSDPTTTGLYCGHCHTPLESVKMGNPLGCGQCYHVFGDVLVQELLAENKLPKVMQEAKRNQPLHIGMTPDKPSESPSSNRLTALNEALNEALQKENYEEAAWIRDQIKELTENPDE